MLEITLSSQFNTFIYSCFFFKETTIIYIVIIRCSLNFIQRFKNHQQFSFSDLFTRVKVVHSETK